MSENLIPKIATLKNFAIFTAGLAVAIVLAGVITPMLNRGLNSLTAPKAPAAPAPTANA